MQNVEFLTKEDLVPIQKQLEDIKALLKSKKPEEPSRYIRSGELRKRLGGMASSSLKNLRDSGKLPYHKVEGVFFYDESALEQLMNH